MSDGYPTAAQKEALRVICDQEPVPVEQVAERLLSARRSSPNPGYAPAIARMAGTLIWRLQAQGFVTEAGVGRWATTADGRDLIACLGRRS
ncbi:hypothetical protein [Nonomuraea sp. NPDC049309]|uniref:hypothetical protein n=1 Tax=Nonomuraea sp. NPDC049309 TaxID=3364350 RepID=UPI00371EDF72